MAQPKITRITLATLPTPLEDGGKLPSGAHLWVKRDDLTGLGVGGNKARKLEFLCGQAIDNDAKSLVTVGAAQSNHCRMTAAAGARLGLPTHLVVSGEKPNRLEGNQLLAEIFGAALHHTGLAATDWAGLEEFRARLTQQLVDRGEKPQSIPIGGSTAVGAIGYALAFDEIIEQCAKQSIVADAIVFTTSSGGTHAGLVAGLVRARAQDPQKHFPKIIGIGVAKGMALNSRSITDLANKTLTLLGLTVRALESDVVIDPNYMGSDYAVATQAASDAAKWAAHRGAWVLDSVYSAKGFSGLLGLDANREFNADANVIFIHTGGLPSLFTSH
ncbi:MAG: pyridoxal-phosphate dependent enzyme [Actinomycetota bacterium]|nr:pyridoxal-phosphate dependent enzyme [Actinomycetota bacterium]